jgi:hypothetical protein
MANRNRKGEEVKTWPGLKEWKVGHYKRVDLFMAAAGAEFVL